MDHGTSAASDTDGRDIDPIRGRRESRYCWLTSFARSAHVPRTSEKSTLPRLQKPFLHDFLQEKNILRGFLNRVYAGHFRSKVELSEWSFATIVREQISRQFCVPFCLIREEVLSKALLAGFDANSRARWASESQWYGGRRKCAQTPCVPVVPTGERPSQGIPEANRRREVSGSDQPQDISRKAGRDFWKPAGSVFAVPAPFRPRTKTLLSRMDQA